MDSLEWKLTDAFKPKLLFDSSERHRLPHEPLDAQAAKMSDNEGALALNNAGKKLFKDISALIKKQA